MVLINWLIVDDILLFIFWLQLARFLNAAHIIFFPAKGWRKIPAPFAGSCSQGKAFPILNAFNLFPNLPILLSALNLSCILTMENNVRSMAAVVDTQQLLACCCCVSFAWLFTVKNQRFITQVRPSLFLFKRSKFHFNIRITKVGN